MSPARLLVALLVFVVLCWSPVVSVRGNGCMGKRHIPKFLVCLAGGGGMGLLMAWAHMHPIMSSYRSSVHFRSAIGQKHANCTGHVLDTFSGLSIVSKSA